MVEGTAIGREPESWLCPPPPGRLPGWDQAIQRLSDQVRPLASAYANRPSMFGLELQTAYVAIEHADILVAADNDYWVEKTRNLFRRPGVEPAMTSLWMRSKALHLSSDEALRTASLLAGYRLEYRTKRAMSKSLKGVVYFEPLERAREWAYILKSENADAYGASKPLYFYAKTIMAHPFTDGNGRFARLLFALALARCLNLRLPCIAFAPSFYRHAEKVSGALSILSATCDWQALTDALIQVIDEAILLTEMAANRTRTSLGSLPDKAELPSGY